MHTYVIRRLLQMIPLLIGISVLLFALMHYLPGGPMAMYTNDPNITEEQLARMRAAYGLDDPVHTRYLSWLGRVMRGDLGNSFADGRPVSFRIRGRLPATFQLLGAAYVLAIVIAIPLGITAALRQYSLMDYVTTVLAYLGISMPTFWFGIILIIIFSVNLGWFPSGGRMPPSGANLWDMIQYMVLPTVVLALYSIAGWSRFMRSSMLEVIRSDYIVTARSKGLAERTVIYKHALRNAIIPVVTVIALEGRFLFSGAVVTEAIFAWPGMGRLYWGSVIKRDYPVLMGILVITALLVIAFNLLADFLYAVLDPRIRYD
ncbi:MAG: ABC transporter permease [Bacillota bacterium]